MGRRQRAWLANKSGKRAGRPGYYVCWNEYPAGRQLRRSRHFHRAGDARKWCRQFNLRRDLGDIGQAEPVAFSAAMREFLSGMTARAAGTQRQYAATFKRFMLEFGDPFVSRIGRLHIDQFINVILAESREATAAKHVRHLKRLFRWCVVAGYMEKEPTALATAKPRSGIVREKPRISDAQFKRLLSALDTDDRKLAVQIAATTGLDRGVICNLTAESVDLKAKRFVVTREKIHRSVYPFLHESLVASVRQRICQAKQGHRLLSGLSHQGGPDDWWKKAATKAGLPDLQFRDLRTYAANWMRRALSDFDTQHALGHSTPNVTALHYWQENPQAQRAISELPLPGSRARPRKARS